MNRWSERLGEVYLLFEGQLLHFLREGAHRAGSRQLEWELSGQNIHETQDGHCRTRVARNQLTIEAMIACMHPNIHGNLTKR